MDINYSNVWTSSSVGKFVSSWNIKSSWFNLSTTVYQFRELGVYKGRVGLGYTGPELDRVIFLTQTWPDDNPTDDWVKSGQPGI